MDKGQIYYGQSIVLHRDLEDCLDLAIRKGKAVGETKPTETQRAINTRSLNPPITRSIGTPACSATEQAGSFFVCFAGNNRALAAKNPIPTIGCLKVS